MKKTILSLLASSLLTFNLYAQTNEHFGIESLINYSLGSYNTACGKKALMQNSGTGNSAFGYQSMKNKTVGNYNTAVGGYTLNSENTSSQNTAIGYQTQESATGYSNTSLGYSALQTVGGSENVAIGSLTMSNSTMSTRNTIVGVSSLRNSTSAYKNTGVGYSTFSSITTGSENVALGVNAGDNIVTGSRNVMIGPNTTGNAASSYNIVMGYRSAAPTGDNNIIIGKKITLPAGTSNAMNIGGVLFGTGFQSALPQSATAAVSNGRIGINVVNPQAALDVNGNVSFQNSSLSMTRSSNEGPQIDLINTSKTAANQAYRWSLYNMTGAYGNSLQFWNYSQASCASGGMCTPRFTIMDNGNVGIGTTNPQTSLDVNGDVHLNSGSSVWIAGIGDTGGNRLRLHHNGTGAFIDYLPSLRFRAGTGNVMVLTETGAVGIGTETTGTHKLAVEGTIGAREIKVEAGTWSDFVFEKDYKLPTLTEVEQHIKEKGHLQDIPSTQEVTQSGINLGAMDAKLLQKIEELMLYTIAQNKEVEALKQIVKLQDEKLQKLESLR